MAIVKLPTDYADGVTAQHKYLLEQTEDGCYLIDDVSEYSSEGSYYGANQINQTRKKINEILEESSKSRNLLNQLVSGAIVTDFTTNSNLAEKSQKAKRSDTASESTISFPLVIDQTFDASVKTLTYKDSRITSDTLAEVFFTSDCLDEASKCVVKVETSDGKVEVTLGRLPKKNLKATIYVRLV